MLPDAARYLKIAIELSDYEKKIHLGPFIVLLFFSCGGTRKSIWKSQPETLYGTSECRSTLRNILRKSGVPQTHTRATYLDRVYLLIGDLQYRQVLYVLKYTKRIKMSK